MAAEERQEQARKDKATRLEEKQKRKLSKEMAELRNKKMAEEEASKSFVVRTSNFRPKPGKRLARANRFTIRQAFTYMFWIYPQGVRDEMSNIFVKGHNAGERGPGVFLYPNSLRLHIRSKVLGHANRGVDPTEELPVHKWTHVTITHTKFDLRVYFDNRKVAQSRNLTTPLGNQGDLWASVRGYPSSLVTLADFRYMPRIVSERDITDAVEAARYQAIKHNDLHIVTKNVRPKKGKVVSRGESLPNSAAFTYMVRVVSCHTFGSL